MTWQRSAQCRRYDPRWWDTETYVRRGGNVAGRPDCATVGSIRRRLAIAALCQGCPVAADCAATMCTTPALMVGVIRAGVAGPHSTVPSRSSDTLRHLVAVAGGASPIDAVLDALDHVPAEVLPSIARARARQPAPYLLPKGAGA